MNLEVAAGVLGTLVGFGFFIQSYKILARKSAKDISYVAFVIIFLTNLTWIAYGLQLKNWPILVANAVAAAGSAAVIFLTVYYNKLRS